MIDHDDRHNIGKKGGVKSMLSWACGLHMHALRHAHDDGETANGSKERACVFVAHRALLQKAGGNKTKRPAVIT
jgi:hypothetical protein